MRVLWIALSLAPSALANSQCDTACEVATGLIDCGFLRDCENHILDEGECTCTLSKEAIAIISIAVIAFIAASVCKLLWKTIGACCGDTGTRVAARSDADKLKADMKKDADKLKADMKKLAEQMAESKAMDEAVASGRLIRTGVGTPRMLHACLKIQPFVRRVRPAVLMVPSQGNNQEHAGTQVRPGRGYMWVDATAPDKAVKLKPNLVVDGAGRVLPAPGFVWVDVSDYTNDRVVPQQVLSIAMHCPSAFGTRAHVPASWSLWGCSS
jgi:hypothetical protein